MKAKKSSTKLNYLWNLAFQIFAIIVPLITTPYVSRVLGSDGVGKFSFSNSIVYYFTLFAYLGFNYYAQREAAKYQNDKDKQSKIFWEIMILKSVSSIIACAVYGIIIATKILEAYNLLLIILSLSILAVMFDTSFLFQANEEFRDITIRNFIVRLITVVLTFVLVKNADDLWIYTLLVSGGTLLSSLVMIPFLKQHIRFVKVKELNIKQHILPTLRLFVPTIAISVYVMLDKTMIGLLVPGETTVIQDGVEVTKKVSDIENGYYEQSEKIVKLVTTVVTSLGIVMVPKNVTFIENNDIEGLKNNIYKAIRFTLMLSLPMTLGLIVIARNFSPWFFGEGYDKVPYLMMILSIIIISMGISGVLSIQYMIPMKKDKAFTLIVTCGAILNFTINLILVRSLYSYGVAISTAIVETVLAIAYLVFLRKDFSVKRMLKESYKYIISSIIMFAIIFPLSYLLEPSIWATLLLIASGIAIYGISVLLLKDSYVKEVLSIVTLKVKTKLAHKKDNADQN